MKKKKITHFTENGFLSVCNGHILDVSKRFYVRDVPNKWTHGNVTKRKRMVTCKNCLKRLNNDQI
jgi:hypothetical protein